jgi:hypothetical protein
MGPRVIKWHWDSDFVLNMHTPFEDESDGLKDNFWGINSLCTEMSLQSKKKSRW